MACDHVWNYYAYDDTYECSACGAVGRQDLTLRKIVALHAPRVEPAPEQEQPEQPGPEPEPQETNSGIVSHQFLVGSNGRVAIRFSELVEFYTMEPREAFDFANGLLNAAYEAHARSQGVITGKLGKHVIKEQ